MLTYVYYSSCVQACYTYQTYRLAAGSTVELYSGEIPNGMPQGRYVIGIAAGFQTPCS